MIGVGTQISPGLPAIAERIRSIMEVILHVGAHHAGIARMLQLLDDDPGGREAAGIAVWGPRRLKQMLHGLKPVSALPQGATRPAKARQRAIGRLRLNLEKLNDNGTRTLLVCDPDILGTDLDNQRRRLLYPSAAHRVARIVDAFDGCVSKIMLTITAQDRFWAATLATGLTKGMPLPSENALQDISDGPRGWSDVVTDLACAAPEADIRVLPAERYGNDPAAALRDAVDVTLRGDFDRNAPSGSVDLTDLHQVLQDRGEPDATLPDGPGDWEPFNTEKQARMLEAYANDVFWLTAGANGLATYVEEEKFAEDGKTRRRAMKRGQRDDGQEGHMG